MINNILKFTAATVALVGTVSCTTPVTGPVGELTVALEDSLWDQSEWISVQDAPVVTGQISDGTRSADGSSWFVTTVKNARKVTSAKWMTTGLGVYDLYVNGNIVGNEILKPGFTHYEKTKISFTYDVTAAIKAGAAAENVFSAQVTPGWWADKIITPAGHEGMIGKKVAFRSVLELVYADGSKEYFGTDTQNWKAGIAGPVKHAAIFDGEDYDAREVPGYDCIDKLGTPEVNTEFNGKIFPSDGAEIFLREDIALSPVKAYTWKDIEGATKDEFGKVVVAKEFAAGEELVILPGETLVVDFGQNCSGVPSFEFKANAGTVLTCLPSELLNDGNGAQSRGMDGPEGSCHRTNLRIPQTGMILNYTFAENKDYVAFCPRSTFFGYRFVSITATDQVNIKSLKSVPVTSIASAMETGTLVTGNEDVNKLISNTIWGQRSNYLSVTTDCPQRNERLGWTADTQVFAETGSFFANTRRFFHKWTRDMRDTQTELGGFPGVAPQAQYGASNSDMMRLGWADAGVIVPWTVWKQFGDTAIIDENWDAMELFVNHINETKYDHTALSAENGNFQWADWLSYEPLESCGGGIWGPNGPLPETIVYWNYLSACYWVIDASYMRDMAAATKRDAKKYENMVAEAQAYIKARFLNANGEFKTAILNTMQTPALFALKTGVVEGKAKENTIERLRKNFAQHDNCLQTGFLGTSILMNTLTENGMVDIAYELLLQHKNPSWLYSVDNGATTIWERWNSYTLDGGMGPKGMNSFNHYAYGCVCEWIWKTVAGISGDVEFPGFKNILMAPVPDRRIGSCKAELKTQYGTIKSAWEFQGDKWFWEITIPEGTNAYVLLPGETEPTIYLPGTYKFDRNL